MRAMDLLEKLAHEHPAWIQPYRDIFIGPLAEHDSWEIRLQIARALPLLKWTKTERRHVIAILKAYVNDTQTFVRAWALDSLAHFSQDDPLLEKTVRRYLALFEQSTSAALRSRAKTIRAQL
jgi:hypothetical protein